MALTLNEAAQRLDAQIPAELGEAWRIVRSALIPLGVQPPAYRAENYLIQAQPPCSDCGGEGAFITNPLWPEGTEPHRSPCDTCGGTGKEPQ